MTAHTCKDSHGNTIMRKSKLREGTVYCPVCQKTFGGPACPPQKIHKIGESCPTYEPKPVWMRGVYAMKGLTD